ncbi:MAG: hypothetical protein JO157_01340, partial [Acetobacteraceae bacterium]|nr:hypothetical protein [Acetobacteraceae bacterium]
GYIGHAETFDEAKIAGSLQENDCTITYRRGGETLAVAIVQRNLDGLRAEVEFEKRITAKVRAR